MSRKLTKEELSRLQEESWAVVRTLGSFQMELLLAYLCGTEMSNQHFQESLRDWLVRKGYIKE